MKIKFLTILSVFIMFFSCKKHDKETVVNNEEETTSKLSEKDLSKLNYVEFTLDSRTEKIIEDNSWESYYQILDILANVKKGDLSAFNIHYDYDGINLLISDLKKSIPSKLNQPATLARITALETKLYKLSSLSNLLTTTKKELSNTIKELLVAFSNLNFQMNKKIEKDMQKIVKP